MIHTARWGNVSFHSQKDPGHCRPDPRGQSYLSATCWMAWRLRRAQPCSMEEGARMEDGLLCLARNLCSQRRCCRVHHFTAITNCWHVVRGWPWGNKNRDVPWARPVPHPAKTGRRLMCVDSWLVRLLLVAYFDICTLGLVVEHISIVALLHIIKEKLMFKPTCKCLNSKCAATL